MIVFAGLPGVGKSAIVDRLGAVTGIPVLSVDPIEEGIHRAGFDPSFERGLAAYLVAARVAEHLLGLGQRVIIEAANAEPEGRAMWVDLAERTGTSLVWIHVTCSDPAVHRARLEGRCPGYPGVDEPTWEAVSARATGYRTWTAERLVLDSLDPVEVNVGRVVAALG